jgi:uncharacterized protein (DUF1810 family)
MRTRTPIVAVALLVLSPAVSVFAQVWKSKDVCQAVLKKYFGGKPDERTLQILKAMDSVR